MWLFLPTPPLGLPYTVLTASIHHACCDGQLGKRRLLYWLESVLEFIVMWPAGDMGSVLRYHTEMRTHLHLRCPPLVF